MKPRFSPSFDRSCVKMADRFAQRIYSLRKLGDRMMKQLLNSVIAKYFDLSVSLLATDKSRYFLLNNIVNYSRSLHCGHVLSKVRRLSLAKVQPFFAFFV